MITASTKSAGISIACAMVVSCASQPASIRPVRDAGGVRHHVAAAEPHRALPAVADEPTPTRDQLSGELTLRDSLALALLHNAELSAASWEIRAREAAALQAGLRPNPELSIEVEDFAGTGRASGFDGSQTTVRFGQLIELGGKRGKRREAARLETAAADWDYQIQRLAVLGEVTTSFVGLLAAQRKLTIAEETIAAIEPALEAVEVRIKSGAASTVERNRTRLILSRARLERDGAAHAVETARFELASTWGGVATFDVAIGNLAHLIPPPPLATLLPELEQRPKMARWQNEVDRAQAALALANAKRVPDATVAAGPRWNGDTDDAAFVFDITVPLPLFDRAQGEILEARHRLARTRARQRAAMVAANRQLRTAYEGLAAGYDAATRMREVAVPEAEAALAGIIEGNRRGLYRYREVLDAQRTLFELRNLYNAALASYHTSAADVERIIAVPLDSFDTGHE